MPKRGSRVKKGRAATLTNDYKRNGTTTLFAALNILNGEVIGQCQQRHTHVEWLKFLRQIDRQTPKDKALHPIADIGCAEACSPAWPNWSRPSTETSLITTPNPSRSSEPSDFLQDVIRANNRSSSKPNATLRWLPLAATPRSEGVN